MKEKSVIAIDKMPVDCKNIIKLKNYINLIEVSPNSKYFDKYISKADVIFVRLTKVTSATIRKATSLIGVVRYGVGYDNVDISALTKRKIPLLTTGTANSDTVAEHTVSVILAIYKNLFTFNKKLKKGYYAIRNSAESHECRNKSILIIGLGRIGKRVKKLCESLGMKVFVYDPYLIDNKSIKNLNIINNLEVGLKNCDIISIHCPYNSETKGLIDKNMLKACKKGSIIINTARGGIVEEKSLYEHLRSKHIRAAAIDVFKNEPFEKPNIYASLDNVILTPHIAGVTKESKKRMSLQSAKNILDVLHDRIEIDLVANKNVIKNYKY